MPLSFNFTTLYDSVLNFTTAEYTPFEYILLGIVLTSLVLWLVFGVLVAWNGLSMKPLIRLGKEIPQDLPSLSVIVPACNEAATIEQAVQSLLDSDYPNLEVILINDRSTDDTGWIMNRIGNRDHRARPTHIDMKPYNWLGKVHALEVGRVESAGDFLLFTDADVHFSKDALRRAVAYMQAENLDHLAMLPETRKSTSVPFWENGLITLTITGFVALFLFGFRLRNVRKASDKKAFVGVGAFNLVRRSTFEKTDGFEWLKMEVLDDVGLGMLMKRSKAKCDVVNGMGLIGLEWYPSFRALVQGFEKNFFAGFGQFRLKRIIWRISQLVSVFILPYFAAWLLFSFTGSPAPMVLLVLLHSILPFFAALLLRKQVPIKPVYFGLVPLSFVVIIGVMIRSAWVVLRKGGISWRGTFYPLKVLIAGQRVKK